MSAPSPEPDRPEMSQGVPRRRRLTLHYYRERGLLRAVPIGRHLRYRRVELERFIGVKTRLEICGGKEP